MGRRLFLTFLLTGLLLSAIPVPVARAPVTGVAVSTDRSDYVVGMTVSATAQIAYSGAYPQIDEDARVDWWNETWALQRVEYAAKVKIDGVLAEATASWAPPAPGLFHVNVSSNTTNGSPPVFTGTAAFRVWAVSDYVIARGVRVTTDRGVYERLEVVAATADLSAILGNESLLDRVQFNWYYPSGLPARQFVNVSAAGGEARDSWAPDIVGSPYNVTATYLGNDTVSNVTSFSVVPTLTRATNVSAGQTATWDLARSPWRACGDLFVNASGTLVIEAGVTVKFCRGSRLIVRGTLTADGTPAAPVNFTSIEFAPAPGDWAGVWFEGSTGSRLVNVIIEEVADGVVAVGSALTLVGLVARAGTGDAVRLVNSSVPMADASIEGFDCGICLDNATGPIANVTVSSSARYGIHAVNETGLSLRNAQVTGGNYSLAVVASDGVQVEASTLAGAAFRAVDMKIATATLVNTSVASAAGGQDFLLVSSTATLLNSTFTDDPAKRMIVSPSRLVVQNFLAVAVANGTGVPVAGARVTVTVNGVPRPDRTTDARGLAEWIVVEDRTYNATAMTKNTVTVSVSRSGYTVSGVPRTVDMATSHLESFTATKLPGTDGPDGFDLLFVALIALVVLAAFLLTFLLLRRRRTHEERPAEPPAPVKAPAPRPPAAVVPGRIYAILAEKPDGAFERFARDVRVGVPGLVVTRIRPEDARGRYALADVPVHWLSRSFGKEALNPTNLGAIVELVRRFAEGKPGSRVLVDGIEYLYTQNDFGKVVKFVQALADVVSERKVVLYLPLNPQSFDPDRLAILTRDLQTLA